MTLRALVVAVLCGCGAAHAETKVEFESLDRPVKLVAHWFAAGGQVARPAVVLLHGCGGVYDAQGRLAARMREYAHLADREGWHALVVDSLTPRGEKELCTQKIGTRKVTMANRRLDALAALQWLRAQPQVDASRIALVGWSNGGSAVLAATNRNNGVVQQSIAPRAAVAFYPGCENELKRGYAADAPLLLLVGASDDWTPAGPCLQLARAASGDLKPRIEVYAGAYHGFDSKAPLRVRTDVPNGAHPERGVTVGGDAAAREASQQTMLAFLRKQFR